MARGLAGNSRLGSLHTIKDITMTPKNEQPIQEYLDSLNVYKEADPLSKWGDVIEAWAKWVRHWKPGCDPVIQARNSHLDEWVDWTSPLFLNNTWHTQWRIKPKPCRIRMFIKGGKAYVYTQYPSDLQLDPVLSSDCHWVGDWHEVVLDD